MRAEEFVKVDPGLAVLRIDERARAVKIVDRFIEIWADREPGVGMVLRDVRAVIKDGPDT